MAFGRGIWLLAVELVLLSVVQVVKGDCALGEVVFNKCFDSVNTSNWIRWGNTTNIAVDVPGSHGWPGELNVQATGSSAVIDERAISKDLTSLGPKLADMMSVWIYSDQFDLGSGEGWGTGRIIARLSALAVNTSLRWPFFRQMYVRENNLIILTSDWGSEKILCTGCMTNGVYHHVEIVFNHLAETFRVCVDGQSRGVSNYAYTPEANELGRVSLGNSRQDTAVFYSGVRVWKRDVTACDACTANPPHPCFINPTKSPTVAPIAPTESPIMPSFPPSASPIAPSMSPSASPIMPSASPVPPPSVSPSASPLAPSMSPSASPITPSVSPSVSPIMPSMSPSTSPMVPSVSPSASPIVPSVSPSVAPPTTPPSPTPTSQPTLVPSGPPTESPSAPPSRHPSFAPSTTPTSPPSTSPSTPPSIGPSVPPTMSPTTAPSLSPSLSPSSSPMTSKPSTPPTLTPTKP
eukprot:Hpha_TRINITY_DN13906_c1_g1::TRINITY_DN13906_c1_g1_i1::g.35699::m.35699